MVGTEKNLAENLTNTLTRFSAFRFLRVSGLGEHTTSRNSAGWVVQMNGSSSPAKNVMATKSAVKSVSKSANKSVSVPRSTGKDDGKVTVRRTHNLRKTELVLRGIDGSAIWNSQDSKGRMLDAMESGKFPRVTGAQNTTLRLVGNLGIVFWKVALKGEYYTRTAPEGVLTGSLKVLTLGGVKFSVVRSEKSVVDESRKSQDVDAESVNYYFPSLVRKAAK